MEDTTIKDANEIIQKLFASPIQTRSFSRHTVIITTPDEMEFTATANTKVEAKTLACQKILDFYDMNKQKVKQNCPHNLHIGRDFGKYDVCDGCVIGADCERVYKNL